MNADKNGRAVYPREFVFTYDSDFPLLKYALR